MDVGGRFVVRYSSHGIMFATVKGTQKLNFVSASTRENEQCGTSL